MHLHHAPVAVICAALSVEYVAVRRHLDEPVTQRLEERDVQGTLCELGTFTGQAGTWSVVLAQTGVGDTSAAIVLERAISAFAPRVALFVGVAGGIKDVALGDVVVPEMIYEYDSGKVTGEGFEARVRTHKASYRLVQRARAVAMYGHWQRRIHHATDDGRSPAAVVQPLAAGSIVVADPRSSIARHIYRHCGDAVAVEMEGHGFLHCAHYNDRVDALVVRGISDLLDKTEAADKYWQPIAAEHAAAFAFETLACHTLSPDAWRQANPSGAFG
ncbi:5'-methylthioadenosine/S-adenosylhomocysteine nucleosidase family protein [Amycolatopsis samaneae]|uniref:5'-methylthioadenosine/S-adenosylhomocysteine nucleosidase n=1 Tax=Amycolatopsis samaneae TaxID=664691 RepID=A0ABW5GMF1_9PSEU